MKKIFAILALQLSYVNAMESREYVLDFMSDTSSSCRVEEYITKNTKDEHKAYKNISDASLFDRMMSDDKSTKNGAWNTISDTGRLTAITYQAGVAENEKIRKTESFKNAVALFEKIAGVLTVAENANEANLAEIIEKIQSGAYKKDSTEPVNVRLAMVLANVLKEKDIQELLVSFYNDLYSEENIEIKKNEFQKIRNFVNEKFKVLNNTFLQNIENYNLNAQQKYNKEDNKYNNAETKDKNLNGFINHSNFTIFQIQNDLKKIANILKEGLEDVVDLFSKKRTEDILKKYKDSRNQELEIIGSSKRNDTDDNLSAVFFYNKKTNVIDINCIGTHNLLDWIYNFDFLKSKGNLFNTLGFGNNIHGGFASLANYAYQEFNNNKEIKKLIKNGATIQVAGHSLGGAMAQVLGNQLRKEYGKKVSLMTFCQPPAFDANEADSVTEEFSGDYLRFFNPQDIVHNTLFNVGKFLPGDLNIWYKHSGVGIEIDQDILTKLQNFLIPVMNAHNIGNNAASLPRTLKKYVEDNKEIYEAYKKSEKTSELENKKQQAFEKLSCFSIKENEYKIEWKENSKAPEARKEATLQAVQEEFENLKKLKTSFNSKDNAEKITNFAKVVLQKCENVPGDNVGRFVRETLQTLNKHVSKKTKFKDYTKYREQIIEALKTRFNNYSDKSARDTLMSIAHLYEKDFNNLKFTPENPKDVRGIEKSLVKINFLKEQLKKMKKNCDEQNQNDLTMSRYAQVENNTKELEDCIGKLKTLIKNSEALLYKSYNDALYEMIKKDQSKRKSNSMTFARELTKLGLEIDTYHFGSWWMSSYQGAKKIDPKSCFENLMKYHGYQDKEIERELNTIKKEEIKQNPENDLDGISDNGSDMDPNEETYQEL